MDRRDFIAACASSLALSACGGGGNDEGPAPAPGGEPRYASSLAAGDLQCLPIGFEPQGMLECNGQTAWRVQYPALFAAIGTTFGSDDANTFKVPTIAPLRPASGPPAAWYIAADPPIASSPVRGLVGEVRLFAYEPDPQGAIAAAWLPCDGRSLPIRDFAELYSVMGDTSGGGSAQTFKLPRIEPVAGGGATPLQHRIAVTGDYPNLGGDATTPTFDDLIGYLVYLPAITRVTYGQSAARLTGGALCQGQVLPLAAPWLQLGAALGNRYGGADRTFQLPTIADANGIVHVLLYNGIFPSRG